MAMGQHLSMLSYSSYCLVDQVFVQQRRELLKIILFNFVVSAPVKIQNEFSISGFLGCPISIYNP